jgi:hypothetical protein
MSSSLRACGACGEKESRSRNDEWFRIRRILLEPNAAWRVVLPVSFAGLTNPPH